MKKIFALASALCLMTSAFCITSFAEEGANSGHNWVQFDTWRSTFGSMVGEGSLAMIIAILALATSVVSIFLTVYYNKKKDASPTDKSDEDSDDESDDEE